MLRDVLICEVSGLQLSGLKTFGFGPGAYEGLKAHALHEVHALQVIGQLSGSTSLDHLDRQGSLNCVFPLKRGEKRFG